MERKNQQTHITRFLIIVAMALIGCYIGLTPGWTAGSLGKATPPLPSLRGEAAIGHLKQTELYHALSAAMTAARCGDLQAKPAESRQAILLNGRGAGAGVRYDKRQAIDALGRELEARMKVAGDGVKLEVREEGAIYPVTIEPTFTQQQQLQATDTLECDISSFGDAVAISGETVVVGAPSNNGTGDTDQGSAYVFVRSGAVWIQQQKLTASDAAEFDYFGRSVAINGETIVVGAANDNHPFQGVDQGSAYVFVRSGGVWSQQQKLEASDGREWDNFGFSVAISGETVVVGASGDDHAWPITDQGSAYVFVRSGGVWSQQQKLTASDAAGGDEFGISVAISGETIVVGAYLDDAGNAARGSAYVFVRSDGVWSQQQKLDAPNAGASDNFGYSVAISGETIVVGAVDVAGAYHNVEGAPGSAHIFVRSGAVWSQQQKLEASDAAQSDWFGLSVTINGETVVVGAPGDDDAGLFNRGSAYVFVRSGAVWTQQQKLVGLDVGQYAEIGFSVAISGETVVLGAPNNRLVEDNPQGSAYVFVRVN